MTAQLYGVFVGSKFGITRNKRRAIKAVKSAGDGQVRSMPIPSTRYWDSPTFYTCSEPVYVLCAKRPKTLLVGMVVKVPGHNEFGIVLHAARGMVEVQPVEFTGTSWLDCGGAVTVPAYSIEATPEYKHWDVGFQTEAGIPNGVSRKLFYFPYEWMALKAAQHIFGAAFVRGVY